MERTVIYLVEPWCSSYYYSTTSLTNLEFRFCAGSARGVSKICDGEDLWQCFWLEIRLHAFCRLTMPKNNSSSFVINSSTTKKWVELGINYRSKKVFTVLSHRVHLGVHHSWPEAENLKTSRAIFHENMILTLAIFYMKADMTIKWPVVK